MDLTPQVINEIEFSMARRGYDPDQVDEFLEKVAVAVGELNDRLGELRERMSAAERRAAEAERRATERPERVVGEAPAPAAAAATAEMSAAAEAELETLKRTLLLAQRTADAAVREAEQEAHRIVAEAQTEAREAHEATRREVLQELGELQATRDALQAHVDAIEGHLGAQRSRLAGAIADLQQILEDPERLRGPALPEPEPEASAPAEPPAAPVVAEAPEARSPGHAAAPLVAAEDLDDEAWARFGSDDDDDLDLGPRTEPVLRLDRVERGGTEPGEDAYLTELRKAMLDDTGAPTGDPGFFDDQDAAAGRTTRFGRRR